MKKIKEGLKMKKVYLIQFCDEWKSIASMSRAEYAFKDTKKGRANLLVFIKAEIAKENIIVENMRQAENHILHGNPVHANNYMDYANISVLDVA